MDTNNIEERCSLSPQRGEGRGEGWERRQSWCRTEAIGRSTPHPHSLSPLRGEGGPGSRARKSLRGLRRLSNHGTHSAAKPQPNERKRTTNDSPSPLNGERAGVRGGNVGNGGAGRRRSAAPPPTLIPSPRWWEREARGAALEKICAPAQTFKPRNTQRGEPATERTEATDERFSLSPQRGEGRG